MIFCFRTSFPVLEHPFSVLERLFPVLECLFPVFERPFPVFLSFWEGYFVPGRDGTEEFVPGNLLLPLSRDTGTRIFFYVTGQRDKLKILPRVGTGRDLDSLSRPGTSRGTETKEKTLIKWNFFL